MIERGEKLTIIYFCKTEENRFKNRFLSLLMTILRHNQWLSYLPDTKKKQITISTMDVLCVGFLINDIHQFLLGIDIRSRTTVT